MILDLVLTIACMVQGTWVIVSCGVYVLKVAGYDPDQFRFLRRVWAELKPFYWPAYLYWLGAVVMQGEVWGWNTLNIVNAPLCWYLCKDVDDDDRWKRRKAKATEKIKRIGSRLVVVPARSN